VAATIAVHRRRIVSQDDLDALEDEAVAEAIAAYQGAEGEGTADVAVYTQVLDDETGEGAVAMVMAVAAADGGLEAVGDEPGEAAVMVTDAIGSDDELAALEAEAVEGAVEALYEAMDEAEEDIDLTLYTGVADESEDGQTYAAVVAIAARVGRRPETTPESPAVRAPHPKDLERVEGIGPKIAELLIAHHIRDLDDLAVASVAHLRDILAGAGKRFRLADPASWPEQAALGAKGLWDVLAALQTRLKGGR
jgi:predicted flap endonuclease-1-like 5' DNA nuclease